MSMSDALRGLKNKVPWLSAASEEPIQAVPQLTVLQEMEALVRMAGVGGAVIDRQSQTWVAVSSWAATELLDTFVKQEGADEPKGAALRARARTLRDLLAIDERKEVVRFNETGPYIP